MGFPKLLWPLQGVYIELSTHVHHVPQVPESDPPVKVSTDDSVPESQSKHEESARLFQPVKNTVASNSTQTWLKQVGLIHQVLPECSNIGGKKRELLGSRTVFFLEI